VTTVTNVSRTGTAPSKKTFTESVESHVSESSDYLVRSRYEEGGFVNGSGNVTQSSMVPGLSAIAGQYMAGVRDGMDSSVGEDELRKMASEIAEELDGYWDEDKGAYDFRAGTVYSPSEVGSVAEGSYWLSEYLLEHGDGDTAATVARRAAEMAGSVVGSDIVEPWGIPDSFEFTEDGIQADRDTVSIAETWKFAGRICFDGGPDDGLVAQNHPDTYQDISDFLRTLLAEAIDESRHLDDEGLVAAELNHGTGEITDERYTAEAIGNFLAASETVHRNTDYYRSASEWDGADQETVERAENFYDTYLLNYGFYRGQFFRGSIRRGAL